MRTSKQFNLFPIGYRKSCPKCGNDTTFVIHSEPFCEDCCMVWIECICGFDPTTDNHAERLESVMGGVGIDNLKAARVIWNDLLEKQETAANS